MALMGALVVTACGNGASVQSGESVGTDEIIPVAEDGIQISLLSSESQWAEPFDAGAGASEDISQEPDNFARVGGPSLAAPGSGQRDPEELPTPQNAEPAVALDPSSDASFGLEPGMEFIILELVVRTQEEDGDPRASNDIAAGGAEQETFSPIVPVEPGSDQLLFTDDAQGQLAGSADGVQALNGLVDASADNDDDISDEQDFEAVSSRETIESDAERLKAQETERHEFVPTPLPERAGDSNVALFALQTTHDVGTKVYRRVRLFVFEAGVRNRCAEYPDSEAAQQAFLDAGGPEKDELRIDPDGDGFVCGWDPDVYRAVLK